MDVICIRLGTRRTAWNLPEDVPDKQNRNASLILRRRQAELGLEVIQPRNSDCVSIEVVEPIHDLEDRHHNEVDLPHEPDLCRVCFLL